MKFSLDDWWHKNEVHPTCTAEYWAEQQCSLKELNDWIKGIHQKRDNPHKFDELQQRFMFDQEEWTWQALGPEGEDQ